MKTKFVSKGDQRDASTARPDLLWADAAQERSGSRDRQQWIPRMHETSSGNFQMAKLNFVLNLIFKNK